MDTITLVDLHGVPIQTLSTHPDWQLEDRSDSTNQLTVTVSVADAVNVVSDMELLFHGRRFIITSVDRTRSDLSVDIEADEAQSELASIEMAKFKLDKALLSQAVEKALQGSMWTLGSVADDSGTYYADLEGKKVTELLTWLSTQSGLSLSFDSASRTVSLIEPDNADPDRVFHYGVGVNDIKRSETPPTATVIHPVGANGLTVENVNDGSDLVEDFSWYVSLGLTVSEARKRYSKRYEWSDERYTVVANLLRDAKRKLAIMAQPTLSYELTSASDIQGLTLGQSVYVVDELLDIRITATVSTILTSVDHSKDSVTLDYVPPSFNTNDDTTGDTDSTSEDQLFQAFNDAQETLTATPQRVLPMTINVYSATAFRVGAVIRVQTTTTGLLEGYFLLNGEKVGPAISETCEPGWVTIGLPFLVTHIQANTAVTFDLYLSHTGAGSVAVNDAQVYVATKGAYGGITNERPDRRVVDAIGQWMQTIHVPDDDVSVGLPQLVHHTMSDAVPLLDSLTVPVDVVQPMVWTVGTVLRITGAPNGIVYTLMFEDHSQAVMPTVVDGATELDVSTVEGHPTGTTTVTIIQLNVGVSLTL